MIDDLEDLFGTRQVEGEEPVARRGPGRPKGSTTQNVRPEPAGVVERPDGIRTLRTLTRNEQMLVENGVSVPFLCKHFRRGKKGVEELLREGEVKAIGRVQNGGLVYDLAEAATVLVDSPKNYKKWLSRLTADDLPLELRDTYWAAKLKRQKFEFNAGELWPSAAVMDAFGETAKLIKSAVQLWEQQMDMVEELSVPQRVALRKYTAKLLEDIDEKLVDSENLSQTRSQIAESVPLDA